MLKRRTASAGFFPQIWDNRIGQGEFIGKVDGIGGLNSTQKAQEYLKGESKAPQIPNVKTSKNSGDK